MFQRDSNQNHQPYIYIYIYIDIIHNFKHIHITLVDEVEANKEAMLHGVIGKEATQPASPQTALRG